MRRANRLIAGGALFAATLFTGCTDSAIEAKPGDECIAVNESGDQFIPSFYPVGPIDVVFQEARTVFNEAEHAQGVIALTSGEYALRLATLPDKLTNGYIPGFHETDAVVIITHPELGRVGLTPSCINRSENQFGVPSVQVELPTSTEPEIN